MDEAEKMRRCDYIIHNDESTLLIPQVLALDKKLRTRRAIPPRFNLLIFGVTLFNKERDHQRNRQSPYTHQHGVLIIGQ